MNQQRLFKEIVQFHPGKLQAGGGSGLGLYISHGIMTLHKGSLSVWSAGEGLGSTFTLKLPIETKIKVSSPDTPIMKAPSVSFNEGYIRNKSLSKQPSDQCDEKSESSEVCYKATFSRKNSTIHHKQQNTSRITPSDKEVDHIHFSFENQLETTVRNSNNREISNMILDRDLPLAERSDAEMVIKSSESTERFTTKYMTVLVVDDSDINRKMQCKLLRKRFKTCLEARDGRDAVMIVQTAMEREETIDLVMMDSQMPVMNGLDAVYRLRQMSYNGVVIGLTGNVSEDDVASFLEHGANAVLPKPLDIESFDLLILQLLRLKATDESN